MEISAKTRLLTVIGDPVAHSLSPAMHNAAFRALGLDAVYVALRVAPESLPAFLAMQVATQGAGNVTVPHKEAVERSVARKTDVCARVGACNTFWTDDDEMIGDNTDVYGVRAALAKIGADRKGERWLVVGTGGSARATAVTAADRGATLFVRSRDAARAKAFAVWANSIGVTTGVATGPVEVDVAINATPLGLAGHDPRRGGSAPCASGASRPPMAGRCWCTRGQRRSSGSSPAPPHRPRSCARPSTAPSVRRTLDIDHWTFCC